MPALRSFPGLRHRPRRPRRCSGARVSNAFFRDRVRTQSSALRFSALAAACPTFPAPITSTGAVVPSLAISALSACICGVKPATTATASVRILGVWEGALQASSFPQPDDSQTGELAQACVAYQPPPGAYPVPAARQPVRLERADDVCLRAPGIHPVGKRLSELVLQRQHRRGATQLKDVHRVVLFDHGSDMYVGATSRTSA